MEKNLKLLMTGGVVLLLVIFGVAFSSSSSERSAENKIGEELLAENSEALVYYDPNCGCCGNHATYLGRNGFEVSRERMGSNEIHDFKKEVGVPSDMLSCHTTIIGDYFIEGHMPTEAIEKLLQEKPSIKGIAMPGMPAGSPGMGGSKTEEFVIWAILEDGSTEEFMRI